VHGPLNVPTRGIGEVRVDLLIELVDNLGGRVLGHTDADPEASLIAGTATAGISGSTSERRLDSEQFRSTTRTCRCFRGSFGVR
jgi:hypothetical protein